MQQTNKSYDMSLILTYSLNIKYTTAELGFSFFEKNVFLTRQVAGYLRKKHFF